MRVERRKIIYIKKYSKVLFELSKTFNSKSPCMSALYLGQKSFQSHCN